MTHLRLSPNTRPGDWIDLELNGWPHACQITAADVAAGRVPLARFTPFPAEAAVPGGIDLPADPGDGGWGPFDKPEACP